ncbi:hypothetical protein CEP51_002707 [Fusarium floridanum]|uniref:Succinate dehydrogenase assembly factor 4, mitochondrial n=1 Tax=Fusarium floridanum TaxID=1325733 RepID=A0A428SA14_9HYPO|nr:hypothetical protein CEP51_002707 [Fusarium floridanum]
MRFMTILRPSARLAPRPALPIRPLHQTSILAQDQDNDASFMDGLADGSAKGRTGGGEPLEASSANAPPQPKVSNESIPGSTQTDTLTEEQKREVEEHNRDFEKKHGRGNQAPDDKVDKKFWGGERHGEPEEMGNAKPPGEKN